MIGIATPKGSMKSFVVTRGDGSIVRTKGGAPMTTITDQQGTRGKVWAARVSGAALLAIDETGFKLERSEPMTVEVDFYMPRPKGHYRTGKFQNLLRDAAPAVPSTMPDVDKLIRGVLDALTNIVYTDDGQVVRVTGAKRFGDPPRAEIRIARYEPYDEEAFLTHSAPQLSISDEHGLTFGELARREREAGLPPTLTGRQDLFR